MHIQDCTVGQRVVFGRPNGQKTEGTIVKVNRKTVKIRQVGARGTTKDHSVGTMWTCSPALVTLLTASERSESEILKHLARVIIKIQIPSTRDTGLNSLRMKAFKLRAELTREVPDTEIWNLILKGI